MRYYPLFMNLTDARCLVVGAGRVGCRKISSLTECSPLEVLVLDIRPPRLEAQTILAHPTVRFERRGFQPEDISGRTLVFAATGSREVNSFIAACCRAGGIACNVADAGLESSFLVPALVQNGPLMLAISTGGGSPALAKALKPELEQWLNQQYSCFALLLEKLRPHVLALGLSSDADAEIFRALCAPALRRSLSAALGSRDNELSEALLRDVLPQSLHPLVAELLHELD